MSKKVFLFLKKDSKKETALDFLTHTLEVDKKIILNRRFMEGKFARGFVRINESIVKSPYGTLKEGQTISITLDVKEIRSKQKKVQPHIELTETHILYEDEDLICVNKPSGFPTHATLDPERDHLVASLKRLYKRRGEPIPYLGLHHRLDSDTSGVILFCKNTKHNKHFGDLFKNREIQKVYAATVWSSNPLPQDWEIKNYLARDKKAGKIQLMKSVLSGGDLAHTTFRQLQSKKPYTLVEVSPLTGRTHQIRVHLYEYGAPILGDSFYRTPKTEDFPRLFLHAWKLQFPHPVSQKNMAVEAPIPQEFLDFFK